MCTLGGAAATAKGIGPLESSTQGTLRDKFDALGVHCLLLLAMHLAGTVKNSAVLPGDI